MQVSMGCGWCDWTGDAHHLPSLYPATNTPRQKIKPCYKAATIPSVGLS